MEITVNTGFKSPSQSKHLNLPKMFINCEFQPFNGFSDDVYFDLYFFRYDDSEAAYSASHTLRSILSHADTTTWGRHNSATAGSPASLNHVSLSLIHVIQFRYNLSKLAAPMSDLVAYREGVDLSKKEPHSSWMSISVNQDQSYSFPWSLWSGAVQSSPFVQRLSCFLNF